MQENLSNLEQGRRKLHQELIDLLGSDHVYYNAPNGMEYPCIRYALSNANPVFADNGIYKMHHSYTVTLIEYDVTSDLFDRIMRHFHYCTFGQKYDAEGLHHTVLTIIY